MPELEPLVRRLEERDLSQVPALLRAAFGRWPAEPVAVSELDHIRWKFGRDPGLDGPPFAIFDGERLVGVSCRWVIGARANGRHILASTGGDMAVHPDYQGRGLLAIQRTERDRSPRTNELSYGVSVDTRLTQSGLRRGRRLLANQVEVLQRRLSRRLALRALGGSARALSAIAQSPRLGAGHEDIRVRDVPRFDQRVDAFFERASAPYVLIIERTAEWLNWRHCDPRGGSAAVRYAEDAAGELIGFSVLRTQRAWPKTPPGEEERYFDRGIIADFLTLPGRDDAGRALLRDAFATFRARELGTVRAWLPRRHPYRPLFAREGFQRTGLALDFTMRARPADRPDYAFIDDPRAAIHLMPGDTDIV